MDDLLMDIMYSYKDRDTRTKSQEASTVQEALDKVIEALKIDEYERSIQEKYIQTLFDLIDAAECNGFALGIRYCIELNKILYKE